MGIGLRTTADRMKIGKLVTRTVSNECSQQGLKSFKCQIGNIDK